MGCHRGLSAVNAGLHGIRDKPELLDSVHQVLRIVAGLRHLPVQDQPAIGEIGVPVIHRPELTTPGTRNRERQGKGKAPLLGD